MNKTWLGSIFLKEEDGYKIILKSLEHYKKRLRTIESSPELSNAGTFSQIILQEAMRTHPQVEKIIIQIPKCLGDVSQLNDLEKEIPLFEKALESYKADIAKAHSSSHEYYKKLIDLTKIETDEISLIENAITKIKLYSE